MVLTSPMRKNSLSGISGALDVAAASDITSAMLRDGDGAVNPYFILCESLPSASRGEAARCSPRTEILGQRRLRRFRDARVFDRAVPVRARSFRTTARWWNRRALSGTKLAIEIENVRETGAVSTIRSPAATDSVLPGAQVAQPCASPREATRCCRHSPAMAFRQRALRRATRLRPCAASPTSPWTHSARSGDRWLQPRGARTSREAESNSRNTEPHAGMRLMPDAPTGKARRRFAAWLDKRPDGGRQC